MSYNIPTTRPDGDIPDIAIGIPVYNQVETIREAIESALNQSRSAKEIVISDNHSTDGTSDIVNEYRGRVRVLRPPMHLGMAANWNFCARSCSTAWIGLCSGDDVLLSNYVAALWRGTQRTANSVFVMGGWERLYEEGKREKHRLLSMGTVTRPPNTIRMVLKSPKASFAAFCFKRSVFEQIGGYDDRFHIIQDWMFQFDCAKLGNFVRVKEVVARYRIINRPTINLNRKGLFVDDYCLYLESKIWEAARYGVLASQVIVAAQNVFFDILRYITTECVKLTHEQEGRLCHIAQVVGGSDDWRRWAAGVWSPPEPHVFRERLRGLARNALSVLR